MRFIKEMCRNVCYFGLKASLVCKLHNTYTYCSSWWVCSSGGNRFQEITSEKHTSLSLSHSVQTGVVRLSHLSGCLRQSCRRILTEVSNTGCCYSVSFRNCLKYKWCAELRLWSLCGLLCLCIKVFLQANLRVHHLGFLQQKNNEIFFPWLFGL